MKLNLKSLENSFWSEKGIATPKFDIEAVKQNTKDRPTWIHFGAGNIFRVFVAKRYQELLDKKVADTGIVAAETFDFQIIDDVFKKYDNLTLAVIMNEDGTLDNTVVASVVDALSAKDDISSLIEIFENPSLQIASYTITEKGYALKGPNGDYFGFVKGDLENEPSKATHAMSILTMLLYKRYKAGKYPMTVLSLDNCSHNGDKIKESVLDIAGHWLSKGYVDRGFIDYISDKNTIAFPLSMIDKITPRPSDEVVEKLAKLGLEEMEVIITEKRSYTAAFVNSEVCEYLVIEDTFPNGRPKLEEAGILFGDRDTINNVETMKVTTCLNPLHTALAVSGCILGFESISDEMKDEHLVKLIKRIGYTEGLPVVVDPKILDPKKFIDEVVEKRFVNPYIPDTPQRIATDTSQKVAIRYGKTIEAYLNSDGKYDVKTLVGIPLAIAAWLRYLLALDDNLNPMELSPDPMLEFLKSKLENVKIGSTKVDLHGILDNSEIFGHDLYAIGLGEKIEGMFVEMVAGKNAFRNTLAKWLD